jgi:hypothetical protein
MNKQLPARGNLAPFYASSILVTILMTVVSVSGLLFRGHIYPTEELVRSFVPNDVVNLLIGLPILLSSMWLTRRGNLIGLLFWAGSLFFVLYNYIAYIFALPLSWVFLIHLVLAILSVYSLIGLVASIDGASVKQHLKGAVPEKIGGGIIAGLGILFFLRAIGVIVNSLASKEFIAITELAVNIADFFITPAWIIGGIQLLRRKELGYVAGLGLLFQASMLFIALIIYLLLQPLLTSLPFAVTDVIVIFVMGFVCFVPFVLFLRGAIGRAAEKANYHI